MFGGGPLTKALKPKISVCGASNQKHEVWHRVVDLLGTSKETSRVGTRFFNGQGALSEQTIPMIEKNHCFEENPSCKGCPLIHHCSFSEKASTDVDVSGRFTFADLFCGAGGLGLGFEQAGFNNSLSIDKDEWAMYTHAYNRPGHNRSICADIKDWLNDPENHTAVDVMVGGPPCQSFSNANKQRKKDDTRDGLYKLFVKSIPLFKPKVILIENVRGFERVIPELEKSVKEQGFVTKILKLNARDFGIPQNRARIFTLGVSKTHFGDERAERMLERINHSILKSYHPNELGLILALSGLKPVEASRKKNNTAYESSSTGYSIQLAVSGEHNEYLEAINSGVKPLLTFNHKARYNNDRDIQIFGLLKPGQDSTAPQIQEINPYKSRNEIFKDKYFKLKPDSPCKTITAHMRLDCNMYIHPYQARGLTVREAARVQGFPDNYVFAGTLQAMYRQVGNAVPPPLAKVIASKIHEELVM